MFVNDSCETVQARVVIVGMQVDIDVLYRGIANQPSPAYSFCICPIFFLSIFWIIKFLVKDFCETVQARVVIESFKQWLFFVRDFCETMQAGVVMFCMEDDNDVLYCGIANQPFHAYSSQHLTNFLAFHTWNNEIFSSRFLWNRAPGRVAQSVGHLTRKSGVLGSIPGLATYFRFSFCFFKKGSCQLLAKVCAWSTG